MRTVAMWRGVPRTHESFTHSSAKDWHSRELTIVTFLRLDPGEQSTFDRCSRPTCPAGKSFLRSAGVNRRGPAHSSYVRQMTRGSRNTLDCRLARAMTKELLHCPPRERFAEVSRSPTGCRGRWTGDEW